MNQQTETDLLHPAWQQLKQLLEARRGPIQDEIRKYPPPIPACDAHFNHLLDQRSALSRELIRLDAVSSGGGNSDAAVEDFVRSSTFLDDETARSVLATIAAGS
mgnify:CR=1 FL=1